MQGKNNVTLKEALEALIRESKLKSGIDEIRVRELWIKLMGAPIVKYTQHLTFRKGKLYVKVESAPLKQELGYSREKIKTLFNRELGEELIHEVIIL